MRAGPPLSPDGLDPAAADGGFDGRPRPKLAAAAAAAAAAELEGWMSSESSLLASAAAAAAGGLLLLLLTRTVVGAEWRILIDALPFGTAAAAAGLAAMAAAGG